MCVCEARVHVRSRSRHVFYKLRNSLGGYGGIRVVRVSDDLGSSSSSCGRGGVVAKSAAIHSRWCVKKSIKVQMGSYGHSVFFPSHSVGQSAVFEDFHCLNSYPLDQVGCELISCILARKPCTEPLTQRHILFIVSAAAVRLTSGRMLLFSSRVYVF